MHTEKIAFDIADSCPECGSKHLVRDSKRGEVTCARCGLVIEENVIDPGPEWRSYDSEQDKNRTRTGSALTNRQHDKGLTTDISPSNKDCNGNVIPSSNMAQIHRLRTWQKRIRISNAAERNLSIALGELDRLSSALAIPNYVRETAALLYKRAVKKNMIRGRSIGEVVAASVYAACRQCNIPRTLDEVAIESGIGRKGIGRTYRFLSRELKLGMRPTKPQDYVQRFCSELNLSIDVQNKAMEILKDAEEMELTSGRGPTGVAAGSIYISSILLNERRTQKEVADVSGVTEVTIRNRYKELSERLGIEVIV